MRPDVPILLTALIWATATAVSAQNAPQSPPNDVAQQITACRGISDPAQRLTCYDQAAAAFEAARAGGDLVIMSRADVQASRRSAFGFNINLFNPLASNGQQDEGIDSIESTVTRARQLSTGRWVVSLQDGSTWAQIDDTSVHISRPEGAEARVRRGAIGSYLMSVGSSRAFRVRRQND